ncbi:unnamed protein product [Moneuplotes crassus]|uniref:Histidine kinase domain-containing protein n=1 Tax=Euplotes crassus TaxID=5936 RepID=A0AAD1Y9C7_EUPCR|nr:unnamed protein product [Moneuplotes crassus]
MMKKNPTQSDVDMFIDNLIFTIGSLLSYVLLWFYPRHSKFYLCLSCPIGFCMLAIFYMTHLKGHHNCYVACYYCYCFFCAAVIPSKRDLNNLIFFFGITSYMYGAYQHLDGEIGTEMVLSGFIALTFFYFANNVLHSRLKHLYVILLRNSELIKEKREVVHAFPHSVLIIPEQIDSITDCYCNNEFRPKIADINSKVEGLKKVNVSCNTQSDAQHCAENINLYEYLIERQNHLTDENRDPKCKIPSKLSLQLPTQKKVHFLDRDDKEADNVSKNFSIKSLKTEWKGHPSFMHVFIDTTDIIKLEEAKNRIKLQKIMFASASHEFKTPLNVIINSFRIISENFDDLLETLNSAVHQRIFENEDFKKSVSTICRFTKTGTTSSTLLLALAEDILSLSKIDNGAFISQLEDFSVPSLLREVRSLFIVQCTNKNIKFEIECDDILEEWEANSDRNRIRQVLLNLVSNSLKFTFGGAIIIKASLARSLNGSQVLEFRVKDTGVGIKEEDQDKIFELYGMVEDKNNLNPNGCGLGLTISKKYIELLGGKIWVNSIYGSGTEMIFTILPTNRKILRREGRPDSESKKASTNFFEEYHGERLGMTVSLRDKFNLSKISPF